jgi:hypothetical protein
MCPDAPSSLQGRCCSIDRVVRQEEGLVAVRLCIAVLGFDSFLGAFDLAGYLRYRSDIRWRPDQRRDRNAERRQATKLGGGCSERRVPHGSYSTRHRTEAPRRTRSKAIK